MSEILEYKGYRASIEYDTSSSLFHGRIEEIDDLVTFESKDNDKMMNEFRQAVDDYLEFCESIGKSLDKKRRRD